ncbi:MAG: hypothetical protein ACI9NT_002079 [Bacteroidia bacterium]|jgi:hypothetical protein
MESAEPRHILFVVGMHRSGTSALCAALHACGATFGDDLLRPMRNVNEQGFWESAAVVDTNDRLLALAGSSWYSVQSSILQVDWAGTAYDGERDIARSLLQAGIGAGRLEVIKDPRLCLTLPFWIELCKEIEVQASVCTMWREPREICQSLEQRDGFPPGHCMRLLQTYSRGMASAAASQVLSATYDALLSQPLELLNSLSQCLPLQVDEQKVTDALDQDLRHYTAKHTSGETAPDVTSGAFALPPVDVDYPAEDTVLEFAARFVDRGRELTRIGEAHTVALDTIQHRDGQLAKTNTEVERLHTGIGKRDEELKKAHEELEIIGQLHTEALATIFTRDTQIGELDVRLSDLGAQHSEALATISIRDTQIGDFDTRLSDLGEQHTEALATICEREAQIRELDQQFSDVAKKYSVLMVENEHVVRRLRKITKIPVFGRIIRVVWNRA